MHVSSLIFFTTLQAIASVFIVCICTRFEVTAAITRVILLLIDDFACVLDKVDEISLASQLTVIFITLKRCGLVTTTLIPFLIIFTYL